MSMISRMKSLLGGKGNLATLASAATLTIPDDDNAFFVSGSTTITSLLAGASTRVRRVTFIGAASAAVVFTNTNSLTTAGQMYLQGANITLNEDEVLILILKRDGTWIIESTTAS